MPHVALVAFTGIRVREREMLELGMTLPGFRDRAAALARLPALGLLTLAGMTPPHWTCSYHDTDRIIGACARESSDNASAEQSPESSATTHAGDDDDRPDEALLVEVLAQRPSLVAVSALTASVLDAYRFAQGIRAAGVPTVLGGLHATACPDEALRRFDAVVIGDGESVWGELLYDVENRALKPKYHGTTFDLSRSPQPRLELLAGAPAPRYTVQTQRGCPFACEFCAASRLLGPFREKPIECIERELDAIGAIQPEPVIELADDNTFAGRRHPRLLFEALARRRVRYFTECDWRVGERPELLKSLAASGCEQLLIGVESLVHAPPGMGAKRASLQRISDAIVAIQEAGVVVNACFIAGCDGETRASLDRLAAFILDAQFAEVQITLQTPFPGAPLRRRLQREGRLLPDRGWPHYTLFDLTFQPDRMSVAELESAYRHLLREVYGPVATARRSELRREILRKRRAAEATNTAQSVSPERRRFDRRCQLTESRGSTNSRAADDDCAGFGHCVDDLSTS